MRNYLDIAFTPAVLAVQERKGSTDLYDRTVAGAAELEPREIALITSRDSVYVATVTEESWPYVQHKGGDPGFIKILGPTTIGWVERTGNRQYLGTGNVSANGHIAMILMDYPSRTRLKLLGEATYHANPSRELLEHLDAGSVRSDGAITIEVHATAWNCAKYITPRFTEDEVAAAMEPLRLRIAELETELRGIKLETDDSRTEKSP